MSPCSGRCVIWAHFSYFCNNGNHCRHTSPLSNNLMIGAQSVCTDSLLLTVFVSLWNLERWFSGRESCRDGAWSTRSTFIRRHLRASLRETLSLEDIWSSFVPAVVEDSAFKPWGTHIAPRLEQWIQTFACPEGKIQRTLRRRPSSCVNKCCKSQSASLILIHTGSTAPCTFPHTLWRVFNSFLIEAVFHRGHFLTGQVLWPLDKRLLKCWGWSSYQ